MFSSRTGNRITQWLLAAANVLVAGALAWLIAAYTKYGLSTFWLFTAAIAWVLFRFSGANKIATVLWLSAAVLLSAAFSIPDRFIIARSVPGLVGYFLAWAAMIAFLVAILRGRGRTTANLCACTAIVFSFILIAGALHTTSGDPKRHAELQKEIRIVSLFHDLRSEIEAFRSRSGRLPKDEAELVSLRGKPMPVYDGNLRIMYFSEDAQHYRLECCVYDWILRFPAPSSPQRFHAEPF